jgi:5'-3' exonuclease
MGIPRFFYWLYKEYSQTLYKLYERDTFYKHSINIDTYALDLNAIVHPICQQVFGYGHSQQQNVNFMKLLHAKTYPSKRIECYDKICDKINELYNIVKPKKSFIIALDGTAGMSKQYQQRQRRYRSVIERTSSVENHKDIEITTSIEIKKDFDPNEITTGSEFMYDLSTYLSKYIKQKKENSWKDIDVYFSSEQVPGEGEHKIMHLLKNIGTYSSYCIHSPDADLIMLSLSSLCTHEFNNCYIMRENIYQNVKCNYFVVNVNLFSEILTSKFENFTINSNKNTIDKKRIISDFIFFCFFFGNDFLPENPVIITDKSGIDILFLLYTETLINCGNLTKIDTQSNKITLELDSCIYFFELLSKNEELLYNQKISSNKNTESISFSDFKMDYYKKLNIDTENSVSFKIQKNNLCKEYLKGICFTLNYYLYDIPDWYWYYPYHYSPFFSDIYEYLKLLKQKRKKINFTFEKHEPLTPYEQLLAVLPPESSNILPYPISELMKNESPIGCFYPEIKDIKIEVKTNGSFTEKNAILPFIDIELLKNSFKIEYDKILKEHVHSKDSLYLKVPDNLKQKNKDIIINKLIDRNTFKNTQMFINKMKYKK